MNLQMAVGWACYWVVVLWPPGRMPSPKRRLWSWVLKNALFYADPPGERWDGSAWREPMEEARDEKAG